MAVLPRRAVSRRRLTESQLEAQVLGSQPYRVQVWLSPSSQWETSCTCPYDYGGDCKHIVATLLAWLKEPDSFQPSLDVKTILKKRSKSEVVELLLEAISIYPDLIEDLGLEGKEISLDDPTTVVGDVFEAMELYGRLTVNQARARLDLIAQQANRLAKQGQGEMARRTYYELVVNCVRLFTPYGHELIGAYDIPYKFAIAYMELALQQLDQHRATIEAEVKAMQQKEYIEEMYELREALFEIEAALGGWVEVNDDQP